jgi:hypothetical protein
MRKRKLKLCDVDWAIVIFGLMMSLPGFLPLIYESMKGAKEPIERYEDIRRRSFPPVGRKESPRARELARLSEYPHVLRSG